MHEETGSVSSSGPSSSSAKESMGSESIGSPSASDRDSFDNAMSSGRDTNSNSSSEGGFGGLGIGNPGSYGGHQSVGTPGFDGGYSNGEDRDNGPDKSIRTEDGWNPSEATLESVKTVNQPSLCSTESLHSSHQQTTTLEEEQEASEEEKKAVEARGTAVDQQSKIVGIKCVACHTPSLPQVVDKPICMAIDPKGLEEKGILDYIGKSANQLVKGNYTDDVTALGTASQIGAGVLGVDLPGDIRDIIYDLTNWENSWGHAGNTFLDITSLLPGVGALKYLDEVGALVKGTKQIDNKVDDVANLIDGPKNTAKNTEALTLNRKVEISSPQFNSLDEHLDYKQRYNNPQEFIDNFVVENKMNVKFTYDPKYDPKIVSSGKARIGEETLIGEKAMVRDSELFKTIAHEEMHQRLDVKAIKGSEIAKNIISDLDCEEEYVEEVATRYLHMKESQLGKFKH